MSAQLRTVSRADGQYRLMLRAPVNIYPAFESWPDEKSGCIIIGRALDRYVIHNPDGTKVEATRAEVLRSTGETPEALQEQRWVARWVPDARRPS